jgi:hypothetical protein
MMTCWLRSFPVPIRPSAEVGRSTGKTWGYVGVTIWKQIWRMNLTVQNAMCLCIIKADLVRPVHLWRTNCYRPGIAKKLTDFATSCWESLLPFKQDRMPLPWHLAVRTFLNDKMTTCSASGPRDHRTWPFVTFSYGGIWRTESMYLHYPQSWMSCRNVSLQLSTRSRRIFCRECGQS